MEITERLPSAEDMDAWPEFKTVVEVAEILRVSKMTVYRMVHGRRLTAIRAGRSFRIDTESLKAYLISSQVGM